MDAAIRRADPDDVPVLVELMTEFYAESSYPLDRARAASAFDRLLREESHGAVWLLSARDLVAGYVVLTVGYSMEYGGLDAFVDDLFIRAAHRGRGLGRLALAGGARPFQRAEVLPDLSALDRWIHLRNA